MPELVLCPKCGEPTIKEREVYPADKVEHVTLAERIKNRVEHYTSPPQEHISGQFALNFWEDDKPVQLVFRCSTCGYTEVVNVDQGEKE